MTSIVKVKTVYPVTLDEAKEQLSLCDDFVTDDIFITRLIEDSTQEAETYTDTDIALTSTTYEVYDFSDACIEVQQSPLIAITSVAYLDSNGDSQTIDAADYTLKKGISKFSIEPDSAINTDKLTIVYTSGYLTGTTCPAIIKQAIRKKVTDNYDVGRGSYISKAFQNSKGFENALNYFKRKSF